MTFKIVRGWKIGRRRICILRDIDPATSKKYGSPGAVTKEWKITYTKEAKC